MAISAETPITMSVDKLLSQAGTHDRTVYEYLGRRLFEQATSKNVFTIRKPGTEALDSRIAGALGAELAIEAQAFTAGTARLQVNLLARNTGTSIWLPSEDGLGAVNIGVKIRTSLGLPVTGEPIRFHLTSTKTESRGSVQADLLVDLASYEGDLVVEFDLVAEHVAWFSQAAALTKPARVSLRKSR